MVCRNFTAVILGILLFSKVIFANSFTLQLLHFSDVDGNDSSVLENIEYFGALVDAFKGDPVYGPNTLLVSAGDNIKTGPRFYAASDRSIKSLTGSDEPGHADIAMLNAMGVQVSTFGIQDFAVGPGDLKDAIEADGKATARFPYLAANIDFSMDKSFKIAENGQLVDEMAGKVSGYAVVKVNNQRIGLIGIVHPDFPILINLDKLIVRPEPSADISEVIKIIQSAVDSLEQNGVNKIILLSHGGIEFSKSIATLVKGVDIIVTGGTRLIMGDNTDTLFSSEFVVDQSFVENYPFQTEDVEGNPILLVNADGDYKYLGRLVVSFDEQGHIQPDSIDESVSGAFAATKDVVRSVKGIPNKNLIEIRNALQNIIRKQYGYILGYSQVYLDGRRHKVRTEETNLGNLTADANLWYANQMLKEVVHISLKNSGGIRTDIGTSRILENTQNTSLLPPYAYSGKNILDGVITEGHVRTSLTFDNGLVVVNVTAAELKDLLESGVAAYETSISGRFPQVAGVKFTFDSSKKARSDLEAGERIQALEIINRKGDTFDVIVQDGSLLGDPQRVFKLVTLNYLANGGDYYPFLELSNPVRTNLYEGKGYGDKFDFPNPDPKNDPGLNSEFSYTGGEQDALAEYLMVYHSHEDLAYSEEETPADEDKRIMKVH